MNLIDQRLAAHEDLVAASLGGAIDLVVEGAKVLDLASGELLEADVAVHKGFIVGLGRRRREADVRIDGRGAIVVPALIDPHVHVESSMVLPGRYDEIVAPQGTGTLLADPHEIVNAMGLAGFDMMASTRPARSCRSRYSHCRRCLAPSSQTSAYGMASRGSS